MTRWYYTTDNRQRIGPVTSEQLRRLARAGTIRPNDMVQREGSGKWKRAEKVNGLFPAAKAVEAAVTPQPQEAVPAVSQPPIQLGQVAVTPAEAVVAAPAIVQPLPSPPSHSSFGGLNASTPEQSRGRGRGCLLWSLVLGIPVFGLLLVVAAIVGGLAFWWHSTANSRLEARVKQLVSEKEGAAIKSVLLVKKNPSEYDGMIIAADGREGTIHVICDGDRILATWLWTSGPMEPVVKGAGKKPLPPGDMSLKANVWTRTEFKNLVMGKTPDEVMKAIGKPESTNEGDEKYRYWYYRSITKDEITGKVDLTTNIVFRSDDPAKTERIVVHVNFFN
jgi:outer membrane protein assembly factor BamE (lipoprotein component of BamABCDE complex)